jgi:hypothetical protein
MMLIFLILSTLAVVGIYWLASKEHKREFQEQEAWRKQTLLALKKLDSSLSDWLLMLELPQLEEQKRREVVAHRLRIVLIEKLMLLRIPN